MDYIEINKKLWNNKTEFHFESDFYDVDSFLKGNDSLNPIELELLGNIEGKKILHLQCHFGMDTISLVRHGARVTGVDFSEKAIVKAKQLATMLEVDTTFVQSDIYDLKDCLDEKFDMVFTSYGVIGWLPDLERWAKMIHHFLKPGGEFLLVEFHPVIWMFSNDFKKVEFNYMDSGPIVEEEEGTYADREAAIAGQSVNWNHGLGETLNSLIKSGFVITDFKEYNYSPYNCFENTVEVADGKFQIKGLENKVPMIFSVKARMGE